MPGVTMRTFYLARCRECFGWNRPFPFYSKANRDEWAISHFRATGHKAALEVERKAVTEWRDS